MTRRRHSAVRHSAGLLVLGLAATLAGPAAATPPDLDAAIEEALRRHPGLRADVSEALAAMEKVPQVGALPDPTVVFAAFATPVETRVGPTRARFALSQAFPWFGVLAGRKDAAAERAKARLEVFRQNRARLVHDIRTTFADLWEVRRSLENASENVEILDSFRQLALIALEAGTGSAVDELRVEMERIGLEARIETLREREHGAEVRLVALLGGAPSHGLPFIEELPQLDHDGEVPELWDRVVEGDPELRRIDHEERAWAEEHDVARREGLPRFDVGLEVTFVGESRMPLPDPSDSGDDTLMPRVGVTVPLDRRKVRARLAEIEASRASVASRRDARLLDLRAELEHLVSVRDRASRRLDLADERLGLAERALDLLLAEYSTDGSDFRELLEMERRLLDVRLERDRAAADGFRAESGIERLLGGPRSLDESSDGSEPTPDHSPSEDR